MGLSPTMRFFGTAINDEFGEVEESGILIRIDQILEEKRARHMDTYMKSNPSKRFLMRLRKIISVKAPKRKEAAEKARIEKKIKVKRISVKSKKK
jgi:hypothetical protein